MENKLKALIFSMLKENTGIAMMDSGGENGRQWQKNATKSLEDFENEPIITKDEDGDTISLYHYLTSEARLSLDELCNSYNKLSQDDWDSDIYGVSIAGKEWLTRHELKALDSFNSYNGEQYLSQVIQGTYLTQDDTNMPDYVLLQVHGGADVRGGYTDAKLFKVSDEGMTPEIYLLDEDNQ